jgi:nucleoside-diphosphate-sugar epimerase
MPPMSQIAWVAGATGYTGRALVAALRAQGVTTHAHVRPDSPALERWRTQFTALGAVVETTPWELAPLTAALRGCAATQVYGLLGTTRARARAAERSGAAPADYERVDVGLTLMLLAAAQAAGNRPRFVYLSATGVRGPADGNAYMRARGRVEAAVRSSGLPFTIARPSFITGGDRDESRPMERVGAAVTDATLGLVGLLGGSRVRDRYRSTTNTALAAALVRSAADPRALDRVLDSEELRDRPCPKDQ